MKIIRIKFSGMNGSFDPENNFIVSVLKKHFKVELSDTPDYLFYSVISKDYLNYNCVKIFFTPENLVPDFNICDYAIGFHHIDFGDRYIRFPLYLVSSFVAYKGDSYGEDLILALHKHENIEDVLREKTEFCSFVYSNSEAAPCRERFYHALSQYIQVNSGGRYMNNVGGPVESKLEFQKKHKFAIAFENSSTPGYTTEKIVHAFAAGTIPIYWGDPEIVREFNPNSFINCHEYGLTEQGEETAIRAIVERVKAINEDPQLMRSMLSAPAFNDKDYAEKKMQEFEDFLINIFSQDRNQAFRRNRLYWGERYERKQKIGNSVYWQLRKLIPLRDALKRIGKR